MFAVEYENSLETDLKGDTSGDLETLLIELSKVSAVIMVITNAKKGEGGKVLLSDARSP